MALLVSTLVSGLVSVFQRPMQSPVESAQAWAAAYQAYAATAQAAALLPVFTGTELSRMGGVLTRVMSQRQPSAAMFASILADGVEAFWMLPPVPFATPGAAGAVVLFPGKVALVGALLSTLSGPRQASAAATSVAQALDAATKTVTVSFSPPPGGLATLV